MPETNLAGPMAVGTGEADAKGMTPSIYLNNVLTATEFAERFVARRLRVSAPLARVVVALAGLGNMMEAA